MLGKLMKHELNATGKIFIPLYFIILILSVVNRVLTTIDIYNGPLTIIRGFMVAAYIIAILITLAVTFVIIILRFYKNLMSDEGYLMFTLPVKSSQLICTKLIVSIIWNIISILIVIASLLIFFGTPDNMQLLRDFIDLAISSMKEAFGGKYILFVVEFILLIFISIIQQTLLIYVSISIGHLFSGHRVLGSFISYIAINTIMQLLITLILAVWANLAGSSLENLEVVPQQVFPFSIVIAAVFSGAFYFVTKNILGKRLNLE